MMSENDTYTLGAILYEGFELLDLYGPLEMFGALPLNGRVNIVTAAEETGPVASYQGPQTVADCDFRSCPDLLHHVPDKQLSPLAPIAVIERIGDLCLPLLIRQDDGKRPKLPVVGVR